MWTLGLLQCKLQMSKAIFAGGIVVDKVEEHFPGVAMVSNIM